MEVPEFLQPLVSIFEEEPTGVVLGLIFWLICVVAVTWKWNLLDGFGLTWKILYTLIGLPVCVGSSIFAMRR